MIVLTRNSFLPDLKGFEQFNFARESFIQILPNETIWQTTDLKEDICFGGNIKAEIIDEEENIILDITNDFYYNEFTDSSGIKQIEYEFGFINDHYFKRLFLKLTHTVSDIIWYSNGFYITNENWDKTTAFYTNNQSVRLRCYFQDYIEVVKTSNYTQLSGNEITLNIIRTPKKIFRFELADFDLYKGLCKLLSSNTIYINGFKVSNKPIESIKKGERIKQTNMFTLDFEANITDIPQEEIFNIYQVLTDIDKSPKGFDILDSYNDLTIFSSELLLTFNKNFSITSDIRAKVYKNGVLFSDIHTNKITINGVNQLQFDMSSNPINSIGIYKLVVTENSIYHGNEIYTNTDWIWEIKDGFYDLTYYDTLYYL